MENRIEKRITSDSCRAYQSDDGKRFIEGYAILYEHRSKLIFEWGNVFFEQIARGALDEVLVDPKLDVIHTPNHNYDQVIARTTSGTLKLVNDERGLKYIAEVPNTTFGNDLYESIKRGDIFESSFTFYVDKEGESWDIDNEGNDLRTINKISVLRETSSVTWGAYPDTEVAARSYKEKQPEQVAKPDVTEPVIPLSEYEKKMQLLNMKK